MYHIPITDDPVLSSTSTKCLLLRTPICGERKKFNTSYSDSFENLPQKHEDYLLS